MRNTPKPGPKRRQQTWETGLFFCALWTVWTSRSWATRNPLICNGLYSAANSADPSFSRLTAQNVAESSNCEAQEEAAGTIKRHVQATLGGHRQSGPSAGAPDSDHDTNRYQKPETCFVDLGDKGSGVDDVQVIIAGQKRGVPESKKRWIRQQNSVEPVTVHLKSDGKMRLTFTS